MLKYLIWLIIFMPFLANAQHCKKHTFRTGLIGKITIVQGNIMPSPEITNTSNSTPLTTKIAICSLISTDALPEKIIKTIPTKVICTTTSDKNGNYCIKMAAGKYSLLVKVKDGWYVSYFDNQDLSPITITKKQVLKKDIIVKLNTTE